MKCVALIAELSAQDEVSVSGAAFQRIESIEKCGITTLSQLSAAGNACKLECCVVQRRIELVGELPSYDSEEPESEEKQDYGECSCVPECEPPPNSGN